MPRGGNRAPRLVLDTNIFVAAGFNPCSRSARILVEADAGQWRIVWNQATRRETARILGRIPPLAGIDVDAAFAEENEFTAETHPEQFELVRDPDDRKFAALAAAADATLITNDAHLLSVRDRLDVSVLTPRELAHKQPRS